LYYFDHGYPAADEAGFHGFHGEEVPFVFGTTASAPSYFPTVPQTAQEQRLSDAMMSYWATFARDGVPRAQGEETWRPYDRDRAYMAFEDMPRVRAGPPNSYDLNEAVVCRRRAHHIAWHWNVGIIAPALPPEAPGCRQRG
jgi:para-nitrobenzyl esterase